MGKRPRAPPRIDHPSFSKQGRYVIQVRTANGILFFHVSQLLEIVQHDTTMRTSSVEQVLRNPRPLGYDVVAAAWNAHPSVVHQFATITQAADSSQRQEIVAPGQPMSMGNFLVTPEDCGVTQTNPIDSDLQALTRHVAMAVVHGRQRRESMQQNRHVRRTAAFGPAGIDSRNVRRRYNTPEDRYPFADNRSSASEVSGTFVGHDFSELNQVFPSSYINLDEDETMSAPEPSTSRNERSVSIPAPESELDTGLNALALANANTFQAVPHLVNEDLLTPPPPIDFSALGGEEPVDPPSA